MILKLLRLKKCFLVFLYKINRHNQIDIDIIKG
jgi:hypothetical protein